MELTLREIIGVAVIIPTVSLLAVWVTRHFGSWTLKALQRSFAEVVVDVMAPDLAHISTKVTASLDELRVANSADHIEVQRRLGAVEVRQTDVEARLAAVESRLGIRPPDARTRATDHEEDDPS